ncbi:MAG TPA: hypothetical protein VFO82_03370 [Steroidobacteraceae bacterium]|nr:hypothetical protein [Steroidobacteraceae bacterium]
MTAGFRGTSVAAATLVALLAAACALEPMTLAGAFSNPETQLPNEPRPPRARTPAANCTLIVDAIYDTRSEPKLLGTVAGRPVYAPTDVKAWLHNVVAGLGTRGVAVDFDTNTAQQTAPLVATLTLRTAWVSELHTSKATNTVWQMRLRRGETLIEESNIRGADTVMNWSSGDGELQRMVDRAFGRALDQIAARVRAACDAPRA